MAMLLCGTASAAVFNVDSTSDQIDDDTLDGACHTSADECTLRAAVMTAVRVLNEDVAIVLPSGTYTLTIPVGDIQEGAETGDLDLTAPSMGTSRISILGAGAALTIIDAAGIDRVFRVYPNRNATISGVTLRNGLPSQVRSPAPPNREGGGIYTEGLLMLSDCIISTNTAQSFGGGVANANVGQLTMRRCVVDDNTSASATEGGGGIYNNFIMELSDTTVDGNKATNAFGGGIYNIGTVNGYGNTISNSTALSSGGGILNGGFLTFDSSTVSGNASQARGGGIRNTGNLTLRRSTISGNSGSQGGGIFNSATLVVIIGTITLNDATQQGGGVYNSDSTDLYYATVARNQSDADGDGSEIGGGVFNEPDKTFFIKNTVVAGNTRSGAPVYTDCAGFLSTYNINKFGVLGAACELLFPDQTFTPLLLGSLAELGPLQDNGGPTRTIAIVPPSAMVDTAIDPFFCSAGAEILPTDQRGAPRMVGALCDIGAFEFGGVVPANDVFDDGFEQPL